MPDTKKIDNEETTKAVPDTTRGPDTTKISGDEETKEYSEKIGLHGTGDGPDEKGSK